MPLEKQKKSHRNILFVFDDVVGQIKKSEFDPRLSQLVMNRRHLIFNGTISIVMVTQKYSLIPSRVRSNASWLVLYQLNPMDFETAYRDAVTMNTFDWHNMLEFVYGIKLVNTKKKKDSKEESKGDEFEVEDDLPPQVENKIGDELKNKKYENLGVWVECNMYFKNFKRIKQQ
jgi:hypothetical protein